MRFLRFIMLSALFTLALAISASAQVTVNPGATGYTTLGAAVTAINAGTHTGAITIDISANTTETGAIVLNSSGAGSASYTSILIRPTADGVTISGPTVTGRGLIELNGADNVTIDGDNPNTGGTNRNLTITNTAANTITFTSVIRIALAATIVTSADNNIIKNLNLNGSSTGRNVSGASSTGGSENTTYGVLAGGGASTVAATTAPSAIASTTTNAASGATANSLTIDNNIVQTAARAISVQGSATTVFPTMVISNNLVGNSTLANANQVTSVGIAAQGSTNGVISGNTVYVEGFVASSSANIGIAVGNTSAVGTFTIERNQVNRVTGNASDFWVGWGINIAAGNDQKVRNNFVSNVTVNTTSGGFYSTTFNASGIRVAAGLNHLIYNNSINMNGTITGATPTVTACFTITANTLTGLDIRNNACVNSQTNGSATSAFVAFFLASGGSSTNNWTINNNDYFNGAAPTANQGVAQVGTTAGTGFYTQANFDPTTTAPATNFRAYSSTLSAAGTNDNASVKVDPSFNSATDLHIPGTSSILNLGATIATVTNDIDGDARPLESAYEIGADERVTTVSPGQIQLTAATYAGNEGTSVVITATRTGGTTGAVSVTFAMSGGTATGGGACAGAVDYVNTGGTFNFANGIGGSQTTSVALCTDAVTDPSETFNFTISGPTGGATLGSPSSAVVTITDVPPPFNGTYTVGTAGQYPSLTNAGGIFEAINLGGAVGNITINVTSDLTGELGTNALNQIAGGFTVTIRPSGGAARQIIGSNSGVGLLNFNGADGVTVDGLNTGGNSLLIRNTGTAPTILFINDATTNIVRNSTIEGGSTSSTISISTGTTTGNDNIQIVNNTIRDRSDAAGVSFNAINLSGTNLTTNANTTILIDNNQIFNFTQASIIVVNSENVTFTRNTIYQTAPRTTALFGIGVTSMIGTNDFSRNTIRDMTTTLSFTGIAMNDARATTISRNNIYNIASTSGSTGTMTGIIFNGESATAASVTVVNNFVSLVPAFTNAQIVRGIVDFGFGGNTFNGYYNTVLIDGTASGATNSWACLRSFAAPTTFTFTDNLCFNNRTGGTGNHFAMGDQSAATGTFAANFNLYVGAGATAANYFDYGTSSAGTPVSFTAWQTGPPTRDANSLTSNPGIGNYTVAATFVSQSDLHTKITSPGRNVGTPVAGVTIDFDGQPRPNPTDAFVIQVDIGADEFFAVVAANASIDGRVSAANGNGIRNAIIEISGGNLLQPIYVRSSAFGYFRVEDLEVGETYVLTIHSKRFQFANPSRVVTLNENVSDFDFTAEP